VPFGSGVGYAGQDGVDDLVSPAVEGLGADDQSGDVVAVAGAPGVEVV
jgi:hypothetical protein